MIKLTTTITKTHDGWVWRVTGHKFGLEGWVAGNRADAARKAREAARTIERQDAEERERAFAEGF